MFSKIKSLAIEIKNAIIDDDVVTASKGTIRFINRACLFMVGIILGYSFCMTGIPVEKSTRFMFVLYCLLSFIWWLSGIITDYIFALLTNPPSATNRNDEKDC